MGKDINFTSLQQIFPKGILKKYPKGHIICDNHREIRNFRWLIEGSMDYFISLGPSENEIMVCQISEAFSTLGVNGLNPPGRYTFRVVASTETAQFFEIPIDQLKEHVHHDSQNASLKKITSGLYHQLRTALLKQTELLQPVRFKPLADDREFFMRPNNDTSAVIQLMRCSPFLDQFSETHLAMIAEIAERREYEPYEVLYVQDCLTNGLYILVNGAVSIKRIEGQIEIKQRGITNAGFIFGWSCFLGEKDICNAITSQKTSIYFISYHQLSLLFQHHKDFEFQFYKQLSWLIVNQMNAAFLRYAGLLGKYNLQAVFQLIENNKSRIPLSSKLHQTSHLLRNMNTKEMAYEHLNRMLVEGTSLERHIASLSLELLKDDQDELRFVQGLEHIYATVVNNEHSDTKATRKASALATKVLFNRLNYHIEGWGNLPDDSGHIFIYNHLVNDQRYTLNNNFQITLDSHFISALILDEKYGEPGIRTVRIGQGQEYGHQDYYNKLGHINVYTKESEHRAHTKKTMSRSIFYKEAAHFLEQGMNLIISPEGTSYPTEDSPGPFKLGSFKLALKMKKEPLLIPLVLDNFDKKIKDDTYYCKILPPFKLSEKIESQSIERLIDFVNDLQQDYVGYVKNARQTVAQIEEKSSNFTDMNSPPEIWHNEILRLKTRVAKLKTQDNLIVFYGSSSIRLWVNIKKDLHPKNVLNFGFGGSSFAWCIHYFKEIFKDVYPQKIVLYGGENDLGEGKSPQEVLADCKTLVSLILHKYPEIDLALISIKPSVEREALLPNIIETNLLLSKYIIGEQNGQFINVFSRMITSDNRPKPELYLSDGLHLNRAGYQIWAGVIKEALGAYQNI